MVYLSLGILFLLLFVPYTLSETAQVIAIAQDAHWFNDSAFQELQKGSYNWYDNGQIFVTLCPDNTFSNDTSGVCKPCSGCNLGTFVRYVCEPWADTLCMECTVCDPLDLITCECNQIDGKCYTGNRICLKTVPITLMTGIPFETTFELDASLMQWASDQLSTRMVYWLQTTFSVPNVEFVSLVKLTPLLYMANFVLYNVRDQKVIGTFRNGNPELFFQGFQYAFGEGRRRSRLLLQATVLPGVVPINNKTELVKWFEQQALEWFEKQHPIIPNMNRHLLSGSQRKLLGILPGPSNYSLSNTCMAGNVTCPAWTENQCGQCVPIPCPPGMSPSGVQMECMFCAANTYKNMSGNGTCTPCPSGYGSPEASIDIANCTKITTTSTTSAVPGTTNTPGTVLVGTTTTSTSTSSTTPISTTPAPVIPVNTTNFQLNFTLEFPDTFSASQLSKLRQVLSQLFQTPIQSILLSGLQATQRRLLASVFIHITVYYPDQTQTDQGSSQASLSIINQALSQNNITQALQVTAVSKTSTTTTVTVMVRRQTVTETATVGVWIWIVVGIGSAVALLGISCFYCGGGKKLTPRRSQVSSIRTPPPHTIPVKIRRPREPI